MLSEIDKAFNRDTRFIRNREAATIAARKTPKSRVNVTDALHMPQLMQSTQGRSENQGTKVGSEAALNFHKVWWYLGFAFPKALPDYGLLWSSYGPFMVSQTLFDRKLSGEVELGNRQLRVVAEQ